MANLLRSRMLALGGKTTIRLRSFIVKIFLIKTYCRDDLYDQCRYCANEAEAGTERSHKQENYIGKVLLKI